MKAGAAAPPAAAPFKDHSERTAAEPRQPEIREVTLSKITPVNQTIKLFELSIVPVPGRQFKATQFLPGQWVDLFIPGLRSPGGFTITSAPQSALERPRSDDLSHHLEAQPSSHNSPHIELAVQLSPNPPSQWLFRPPSEILNATLRVRPGGSFIYPPSNMTPERVQKIKRVVFVAGGVGINPLMAMLLSIKSTRQHAPQIVILYATRKPPPTEGRSFSLDEGGKPSSGILFLERLVALVASSRNRMKMSLYRTDGEGELEGNKEDMEALVRAGNLEIYEGRRWTRAELAVALGEQCERGDTLAYVCGPPKMTDEVVEVLRAVPGMEADSVFCEKWW